MSYMNMYDQLSWVLLWGKNSWRCWLTWKISIG